MKFTASALQMEQNVKYTRHDYCSTLKHLYSPFYVETITPDRFLGILPFLYFGTIHRDPTQASNITDCVFDTLNRIYPKF